MNIDTTFVKVLLPTCNTVKRFVFFVFVLGFCIHGQSKRLRFRA